MPIFSKPEQMAVRILAHISDRKEQIHTVRDVARETGVPGPTAAKVLKSLAKDNILESRKGPGGGFRLALNPREVSLARILRATDGGFPIAHCVAGLKECSEKHPCPLHSRWLKARGILTHFLESTNLYEMGKAVRNQKETAPPRKGKSPPRGSLRKPARSSSPPKVPRTKGRS